MANYTVKLRSVQELTKRERESSSWTSPFRVHSTIPYTYMTIHNRRTMKHDNKWNIILLSSLVLFSKTEWNILQEYIYQENARSTGIISHYRGCLRVRVYFSIKCSRFSLIFVLFFFYFSFFSVFFFCRWLENLWNFTSVIFFRVCLLYWYSWCSILHHVLRNNVASARLSPYFTLIYGY